MVVKILFLTIIFVIYRLDLMEEITRNEVLDFYSSKNTFNFYFYALIHQAGLIFPQQKDLIHLCVKIMNGMNHIPV
jgi:hypothetical protein